MSSIEKKIGKAILDRIRERKKSASPNARDGRVIAPSSTSPTKIREVHFSDFHEVRELKQRWGLIPDSFENWERLWLHNPALRCCSDKLAMGWVLESDGKVVGYLGNIASVYRYRGLELIAVTGHGFVVEPAHRGVSLSLMAAFFRQKSIDLYMTTTAIEVVGKIARSFKSSPLPQRDYELVLFWVLRPGPFARNTMKRLGFPPLLSVVGSALATPTLAVDKIVHRRWPRSRKHGLRVEDIDVDQIGEDFDLFWQTLLMERPRLLADRSSSTLRWHFQTPQDEGSTRIFCCYSGNALVGYAVVRTDAPSSDRLRRSLLVDMIAKKDDPDTLETLFVAAHNHANRAGSHILEVLGFPEVVRKVCSRWNPYTRRYPACPFLYKAANAELHKELLDLAPWYASPFDGDTSLMPFLSGAKGRSQQ